MNARDKRDGDKRKGKDLKREFGREGRRERVTEREGGREGEGEHHVERVHGRHEVLEHQILRIGRSESNGGRKKSQSQLVKTPK